ncbi:peptidoglycan-binding protein [Magnetospirillum sp. UT-4]|uniref:peptidoglycan-binding domain-containing protein n=1 Tax=Magnetospirillum sp. UT-4 TaxID=2681467 RepID=UPI00137C9E4D|nr:peptidoglycan-binding domain-containing protein [Magnetospirillum sp. UT-4]CAA7624235.1 exported hypothetical protein [Magnetospirillum sp. UT-4]
MVKTRLLPVVAGAAMALSLGACQWMGDMAGGKSGSGGSAAADTSAAGSSASGSSGQSAGMQSSATQAVSPEMVRDVQRTLSQKGYHAGPVDGIYGDSTAAAVRNFQRDQRLGGSGQLDSQTLAAMGLAGTSPSQQGQGYTPTGRRGAMLSDQPSMMSGQPGMRRQAAATSEVREAQQNLASMGYDVGPVDGVMGPSTRQAVRQFQRDQNLPASGRLDQQTMAAMEDQRGTQTGELPEEPASSQPLAPQQSDIPRTGSQAPGGETESERSGNLQNPGDIDDQRRERVPQPGMQ